MPEVRDSLVEHGETLGQSSKGVNPMEDAFIADLAQAQASKVEAERRQADEARQAKLRAAAKAELLQMQRELQVWIDRWIG